jgi:alkanesulfonate monooxygenase SsuD/methylene tetrahydromethanopterin reductase-like flavin-dependent oxidoreductase (luciferase family)
MRSAVDVLAAALTIAEAFPGRFDLGVGSGNVMSLRKAGIEVEPPPLTVARTFLDTWAGLAGRSGVAALLDLPSTVELPAVLLAAHNQQMISLAMRRADGLILNMVPASDLVATLRHVRNASERAGRASRPAQVGMFQLAAFGPHDAALAAARLVLAGFCRAPAVRKRLHSFHSRYADTADRVAELPPTADAAALVELMPADMVEDFAVTSEAALAERIGWRGTSESTSWLFPSSGSVAAAQELSAGSRGGGGRTGDRRSDHNNRSVDPK